MLISVLERQIYKFICLTLKSLNIIDRPDMTPSRATIHNTILKSGELLKNASKSSGHFCIEFDGKINMVPTQNNRKKKQENWKIVTSKYMV